MAHGTPLDDIENGDESDKLHIYITKTSRLGGNGPTKHRRLGNILHVLRMYGNKDTHYKIKIDKFVVVEKPASARDVLLVVAAMAMRAYTLMLEVFPRSIPGPSEI